MKKLHILDLRKVRTHTAESIEELVMAPNTLQPSTLQQINNSRNDSKTQLVENTFKNIANEGRGVLKHIEDYKFKLEQSVNMLNAVPDLQKKIEQKQQILDSAMAQIYGIVFDLENYDLTPVYEDEQLSLSTPDDSLPVFEDEMPKEEADLPEESNDEEIDLSEDTSEPKMQGGFDTADEAEEEPAEESEEESEEEVSEEE